MSKSETTNNHTIRIRDTGFLGRISEITSLVELSENSPLPVSVTPQALHFSCYHWLKHERRETLPNSIPLGFNGLMVECELPIKFDLLVSAQDPQYVPGWWPLPLKEGGGYLKCVLMEEVEVHPGEKLGQALRDLPLWKKVNKELTEAFERMDREEQELDRKFKAQEITLESFAFKSGGIESKRKRQVSKILRRYQIDDTASTRLYTVGQIHPASSASTSKIPSIGTIITTFVVEKDSQIVCGHNIAGMQHITRNDIWDRIRETAVRHTDWVIQQFPKSANHYNLRRYNKGRGILPPFVKTWKALFLVMLPGRSIIVPPPRWRQA